MMEFFIKKGATLPILKLSVVKDGRNDFHSFMKTIELSAIFFSMVDIETGIPKITSRPAGFVEKTFDDPNAEPEYYIYYQFQNRDTNKIGRYEGQFMLRNSDGVLMFKNLLLRMIYHMIVVMYLSFLVVSMDLIQRPQQPLLVQLVQLVHQ